MVKELSIYLAKLKEEYNYSDKLIESLNKIIPALIEFYGEEKKELIFNALYDCEIKLKDKKEDININISPYCESCYNREIINIEEGEFVKINEIYVFNTAKKSEKTVIMELTYEICQLIKSYKQSRSVGNFLILKTGLEKEYCIMNENGIDVIMKDCTEIEKVLNYYDTTQVVSIIYGEPTIDESCDTACASIEKLILDNKIFQAIRLSQFNNNDSFYRLIGKENYQLIDTYLKKITYFYFREWKKDISVNNKRVAKIVAMKAYIEANKAKSGIESLCTELIENVTKNKKIVYVKVKKQH